MPHSVPELPGVTLLYPSSATDFVFSKLFRAYCTARQFVRQTDKPQSIPAAQMEGTWGKYGFIVAVLKLKNIGRVGWAG